jgi:hypothetical protein
VLTFEPPSATSVGLCLASVVSPKERLLEQLGASVAWPMCGLPRSLYLDSPNADYFVEVHHLSSQSLAHFWKPLEDMIESARSDPVIAKQLKVILLVGRTDQKTIAEVKRLMLDADISWPA